MKNIKNYFFLFIIVITIILHSCTSTYDTTWEATCPCKVYKIDKEINREKIYIRTLSSGYQTLTGDYQTLRFYTTSLNYYQLGDTIK